MIDGLWTVEFKGPQGNGTGAVVLAKGQVLGGDSGFTYVGSYEQEKIPLRRIFPSRILTLLFRTCLAFPARFS